MKLLIVTDAWHPQVNGVVRTQEETAKCLRAMGHDVKIVGPEKGLFTFPAPTYPEIKLEFFAQNRLRGILDEYQPDYIHISTEGPLGRAMRQICVKNRRPYSSAYHTCFPEYLEKRVPWILKKTVKMLTYQVIRALHAPSGAVMVATPSIEKMLKKQRIRRIKRWSRGVDTSIFKLYGKDFAPFKNLPRPIYLYVGRVAIEKNLEAFLSLDIVGSKVVIGEGPHEAVFKEKYPSVHFLGKKTGEDLARHYAGADIFVFPSKTDTFGLVLLEALACGLAIAAYPVQGPIDIFGDTSRTGAFAVLDADLKTAALKAAALNVNPEAAHRFVQDNYSWKACTEQFLSNLQAPTPRAMLRIRRVQRLFDILDMLWRRLKILPKFYPNIYRLLGYVIAPFLPLYLMWRVHTGKEDKQRLNERFGSASRARPAGKLIWCHGASVGEALSLLPLLSELQARGQKPHILLTTGTRSSAEILAKRLPETIIHQYVPFDTMRAMQRFVDHWHPDLALITESELWPNMIGKIRKERIPAALINARMSQKSATRWADFAALWISSLLRVFDFVLAQSEDDAARLRSLGAYSARSVGNLKAAAPPLPCDEKALAVLREQVGGRPVWLMASTHEGEDELALATHEALQKDFPELLTILLPRHPARAGKIAEMARQKKLGVSQRSKNDAVTTNTNLYIADTFGETGLFYRLANIVCVGGSFVAAGGHNPMEPAAFGATIMFGPDMRNFADMADAMVKAGAAMQVKSGGQLTAHVAHVLAAPDEQQKYGHAAMDYATKERAVLARVMAELEPLLSKALA